MMDFSRDFRHSIKLHGRLFFQSFSRSSRRLVPLTPLRLFFLLLVFPLFVFMMLLHWLGFLLDELLFPEYRQVQIRTPVFITGIPRSGTTFIHRAMSVDSSYATMSSWEAFMAPGILERKILRKIAAFDRRLGSGLRHLLDRLLGHASGNFSDIHPIRLSDAEEDYLALLPYGACFILFLAFPFSRDLLQTGKLDLMAEDEREAVLDHYHRLLQKLLFSSGEDRRFLSKNAAFASWLPYLAKRYPDGRFIVCVRNPSGALSSQVSSFKGAGSLMGVNLNSSYIANTFLSLFLHNYKTLLSAAGSLPLHRCALIDQQELKNNSEDILRAAVNQLSLPVSPAFDIYLQKLPKANVSRHQHNEKDFKGDRERLHKELEPVYEDLLKLDQHVQITGDNNTSHHGGAVGENKEYLERRKIQTK